jgi:hypothetical protein
MRDLIISAIANYSVENIQQYIISINKCGFNGDKIMVVYNVDQETINYLQSNGWEVCVGQLYGHPHMKRLVDIYALLKELKREYRYLITTDVRDVIFQTNPSDYLEKNLKKRILASTENVYYRDEPWGQKNILEGYNELMWESYKHKLICNVGVIAGYYDDVVDMLLLNYLVSQSGNTQHFTDQSSFNFVIHNQLVKDKIQIEGNETNWAVQVGTLSNPNIIEKYDIMVENGLVVKDGNPFCIVHQYDRNPLTREIIHRYK